MLPLAVEDTFHLGVKAVIRNSDGKILLLKVAGEAGDLGCWDLPGGRVHRNEDIESALRREVAEETGLRVGPIGQLLAATLSDSRISVGEDDVGLILFAFGCELEHETAIELSSEHSEARWVTLDEAAAALRARYRGAFAEIMRGSLNRGA